MSNNHDFKKTVYEIKAKKVLQKCYPEEFGNLVKDESPDFIDKITNIGVEVVLIENEDILNGMNFFLKNRKDISKINPKKFKILKKYCGRLYTEKDLCISNNLNVVAHTAYFGDPKEMIESTFLKKIQLINKESNCAKYNRTVKTALYMISKTHYTDLVSKSFFQTLVKKQNEYSKHFSDVFLDDGDLLYRYLIQSNELQKMELNPYSKEFINSVYQETEKLCNGK